MARRVPDTRGRMSRGGGFPEEGDPYGDSAFGGGPLAIREPFGGRGDPVGGSPFGGGSLAMRDPFGDSPFGGGRCDPFGGSLFGGGLFGQMEEMMGIMDGGSSSMMTMSLFKPSRWQQEWCPTAVMAA